MPLEYILRSIGKIMRDSILPHSQNPSAIEHHDDRKQKDRLKGFAYFDTFAELEGWNVKDVDPLQRANTPLLKRTLALDHDTNNRKSSVTLIHDYAGGYHDYEACQGSKTIEESYSCEYLQFVDTFVYFSHHLVTVPPPAWINTCHRNGVKILGTFIVEPGSDNVERIFNHAEADGYIVAKQLVQISDHYGFDGWLINIEKSFPVLSWSAAKMEGFLIQLREGLEKVMWYDALTEFNIVWYANTLSEYNIRFAKAAGHLLTNYVWTEYGANNGKERAIKHGMPLENLSFGIDVWAQDTRDPGPPRTTWPDHGGGGTMTGAAVAKLAKLGLSAGIFAPAWAFEHFTARRNAVGRAMWDGDSLSNELKCGCTPDDPHASAPYQDHPIAVHAREWPSGSASFFHCNFRRAFTRNDGNSSSDALISNIGLQSVLPHLLSVDVQRGRSSHPYKAILYGELRKGADRATILLRPASKSQKAGGGLHEKVHLELDLLKYNLQPSGSLSLLFTYSKPQTPTGLTLTVDLLGCKQLSTITIEASATNRRVLKVALRSGVRQGRKASLTAGPDDPIMLTGLRISLHGSLANTLDLASVRLLEIFEVSVQPPSTNVGKHWSIYGLQCVKSVDGILPHWRLVWIYRCNDNAITDGRILDSGPDVPFSKTTGPFSHFLVEINGMAVGAAQALAYVCQDTEQWQVGDKVTVKITGIGFDGTSLACCVETVGLVKEDEDWGSVEHVDELVI